MKEINKSCQYCGVVVDVSVLKRQSEDTTSYDYDHNDNYRDHGYVKDWDCPLCKETNQILDKI
jgi:hypothetical protein